MTANFNQSEETGSWKKQWSRPTISLAEHTESQRREVPTKYLLQNPLESKDHNTICELGDLSNCFGRCFTLPMSIFFRSY